MREGVVLSGDWEREKRREEGLFALEGDKRHLKEGIKLFDNFVDQFR